MSSNKKYSAVRGMNDIVPEDMPYWHAIEQAFKNVIQSYGYHEIRFPIVESTALFKRTIGDVTDVVEKEMYTFEDRNGDQLSLRPEGTAGCVRAGIQQGLFYNQIQRLWYFGPMFRHERPQKGRYRQFYQFGVEAFGMAGPEIEVEQLYLMWRLLQELGLDDLVTLEINTLGSSACRQQYQEQLVGYLTPRKDQLDEDSQRRLQLNPLRILDSKNPNTQALLKDAPKMTDCISQESRQHFSTVLSLLDKMKIPYKKNDNLVRGLDYYGSTVYEWITSALGAQGTVCAGGRYDGLVEQLGGKPTPAIGFAMGIERLVLLLKDRLVCSSELDVYCILVGDQAKHQGLMIAEQCRSAINGFKVVVNLSETGYKGQFKKAHASGARWAVIIGEDEIAHQTVALKYLREDKPQEVFTIDQLIEFFKRSK